MTEGDFRATERSVTVQHDGAVRIEHVAPDGTVTVLKDTTPVLAGEVLDAAVMRRAALDEFLTQQVAEAKAQGRPVLGSPEGHDDEGLGPDHLRPRGAGLLPGPVRRAR